MSKKYTAEWVRDHVHTTGAYGLDHHRCGICNSMVAYSFDPPGSEPEVFFYAGCDCAQSPGRPSSWSEIADWLAMQSSDEIRERIVSGFRYPAKVETVT